MFASLVALCIAFSGFVHAHDEPLFQYKEGRLYINGEASYRATCKTSDGKTFPVRLPTADLSKCEIVMVEGEYGHHLFYLRVMKSWKEVEPLSGGVDIVPLENPWNIKAGEKLNYSISFMGEPVEDVPVFINGKQAGVTRKGGRIRLRLRKGTNELGAVVERQGKEYIGVLIFER